MAASAGTGFPSSSKNLVAFFAVPPFPRACRSTRSVMVTVRSFGAQPAISDLVDARGLGHDRSSPASCRRGPHLHCERLPRAQEPLSVRPAPRSGFSNSSMRVMRSPTWNPALAAAVSLSTHPITGGSSYTAGYS